MFQKLHISNRLFSEGKTIQNYIVLFASFKNENLLFSPFSISLAREIHFLTILISFQRLTIKLFQVVALSRCTYDTFHSKKRIFSSVSRGACVIFIRSSIIFAHNTILASTFSASKVWYAYPSACRRLQSLPSGCSKLERTGHCCQEGLPRDRRSASEWNVSAQILN